MSTAPIPTPAEPLLRIRPASRWQAINFQEIWSFRDLVTLLAGRDLKLRYRQTALGMIWVIAQPLMGAMVFAIVGIIAKTSTGNVPRPLFTFASFLAWTAFSQTLLKSSGCLISNASLVSKVYFPRLVLPLSSVVSVLVDFLVALPLLVIMMLYWGIPFTPHLLLVPVWLAVLLMLALGIGLIAAGLTVQYRDVQYILPVVIQFALYVTPVWFTRQDMPAQFSVLYTINPLSGLIEAFRSSILGTGEFNVPQVAYSVVLAVVVLLVGAFSFRSMERRFADVI
jgi:lipopolysaccharide transport system permease protein